MTSAWLQIYFPFQILSFFFWMDQVIRVNVSGRYINSLLFKNVFFETFSKLSKRKFLKILFLKMDRAVFTDIYHLCTMSIRIQTTLIF